MHMLILPMDIKLIYLKISKCPSFSNEHYWIHNIKCQNIIIFCHIYLYIFIYIYIYIYIIITLITMSIFFTAEDDGDGTRSVVTIPEFLQMDMKGKVIAELILPTYNTQDIFIRTYKISLRLQVSLTIVVFV